MTPDALVTALAHRLGDKVTVVQEPIDEPRGLLSGEGAAIARAIPKRQAEFAAGRRAARRALASFGAEQTPILSSDSRAPTWPEGFIGSITHDQGLALAAIARTRDIAALGIDLTEAAPLPGETRRSILRSEREYALDDDEARAAFAIKESLFKALHPSVQTFFGFEAAVAAPDIKGEAFDVTLTTDLGAYAKDTTFRGVLLTTPGIIVAALAIPASL